MAQRLQSDQINLACQTAEEFAKLYYKYLDKQRNMISKMYLDNATLMWNGNGIVAKDNIQQFWLDMPSTKHTVYTLDAQPITGPIIGDRSTLLLKVSGQVKYKESSKLLNQTFLIMAVGDKWKIVNDCFRTLEVLE